MSDIIINPNSSQASSFRDLVHQTAKCITLGKDGGNPQTEDAEVVMGGAITQVIIYANQRVDGLQFMYGTSPGQFFGQPTGERAVWVIPKGYQITKIDVRSDKEIDSLRFYAYHTLDSLQSPEVSPLYGGTGGHFTAVTANNQASLPLRQVDGRSCTRVDQLTFWFGYGIFAGPGKVDQNMLREELTKKAKVTHFKSVGQKNPTEDKVTMTYTRKETETESHSITFSAGLSFTVGQSFGLTVADIVSVKTNWSVTASVQVGVGQVKTVSIEETMNHPIPIPPFYEVNVQPSALSAAIDVPFSYRISLYDFKTMKEVAWTQGTGTYKGVIVSSEMVVPVYNVLEGHPNYKVLHQAEQDAALKASRFGTGQKLLSGDFLTSLNGKYALLFSATGNLSVIRTSDNKVIWETRTVAPNGSAEMQEDGNFVIYTDQRKAVWATGRYPQNAYALMQDDGNFCIYNGSGIFSWGSK